MKLVDLTAINNLRNGALMAEKIGKQIEIMKRMNTIIKGERPITDEEPLEVKPRSDFPSRQTYRAHVRAWAKQQVRFAKAYARGDLAPHLIPLVEAG